MARLAVVSAAEAVGADGALAQEFVTCYKRAAVTGDHALAASQLKLLLKEPVLPSTADQPLFLWAPVLTFSTSQAAWAALPTSTAGVVSDLNLGTRYFLAIGSLLMEFYWQDGPATVNVLF